MNHEATIRGLAIHRRALVIALHAALAALSLCAAFLLRFDFGPLSGTYLDMLRMTLPFAVGFKLLALWHFGALSGLWRYVGITDLTQIIKAASLSSLAFVAATVLVLGHGYPRSIYVLDYVLTIVLFGGTRFGIRLFRESFRPAVRQMSGKRTLIVGAGDTGELALRSLTKGYSGLYQVVGLLDDDPGKKGMRIHGYRILGPVADAPLLVKHLEVTEVLIAIPSASKSFVRRVVESCAAHNVNFQIMPAIKDLMTGAVAMDKIRKVNVEDLLGRDPVHLDSTPVARHLKGSCVLVTGAGGSIGSEICRQVARFEPSGIVLFEVAESALFEIEQELHASFPKLRIHPCVADVKHRDEVEGIFATYRPRSVFHAAAYKHVPLMETHAIEAVRNNVLGTRNVLEAAGRHGAGTFVLISTDKAVRPRSVMGATKRLGEMIVARADCAATNCMSVRFGNVLGSRGSVVPVFARQIEQGGPVTVTHPDMTRYFMTIPEAVELVLQVGAMGRQGNIYVLDMGTPVRIMDLAKNMIDLSGLVLNEDIRIEVTGLRPGEKLHEELATPDEELEPTAVDKIRVLRTSADRHPDHAYFLKNLSSIEEATARRDSGATVRLLWEMAGDAGNTAHPTPAGG